MKLPKNLIRLATILPLFSFFFFLPIGFAQDVRKSFVDTLPEFISFTEEDDEISFFFSRQNLENNQTLLSILKLYNPTETHAIKFPFSEKSKIKHIIKTTRKKMVQPTIEYRKINPTKYRLRIHGADEEFFLIFSESFHNKWKAYLVPLSNPSLAPDTPETQQLLESYKIFRYNENYQASSEDLKNFLAKGWISSLGSKQKKYSHLLRELGSDNREKRYRETFNIDFISKNYKGTIQNDNLREGNFGETWFEGNFIDLCQKQLNPTAECNTLEPSSWELQNGKNLASFVWPEKFHFQVNGYANSWWINVKLIKKLSAIENDKPAYYKAGPDGKTDFEMIIEFSPQRIYYFGWVLAGITLFISFLAVLSQKLLR